MESEIYSRLPGALLPWYEANRRTLPWRESRDPYPVWLSEVMLQQTRVEAVKSYYTRFLEALPSVEALAACDDDTLHKLWEGLGYYSRVRNLKKAAQILAADYGGEFPRDHAKILALPGIGDYTAGAICSIAFDLPTPAVDGNVLRLITRLTEDETPINLPAFKKQVSAALARVYPSQAGAFTQALMELGATLCGPNRKPECANCPCREFCGGYLHGTAENFPVKQSKKSRKAERKTVFILSCDGHYAVEKRPARGLLAGLWQFPNVDGILEPAQALPLLEKMGLQPRQILRQTERQHIFTHILWNMRGIYIELQKTGGHYHWMTAEQIEKEAALPTAFRQFWEEPQHV